MRTLPFIFMKPRKRLFYLFALVAGLLLLGQNPHSTMASDVYAEQEAFIDTPVLRGKRPSFAEIEEVIPPTQTTSDIQGQFILALSNNDIQAVTRFIKLGAKVNEADSQSGQTPIMMVESKAMAEHLVKNGADTKALDFDGGSALHYVVTKDNAVELIPFFALLGIDTNLRGWDDEPAIMVACRYFHESRAFDSPVITLLGQTAENEATNTSSTPPAVLRALVDAGAEVDVRDDVGNTLLMNVVTWNDYGLIKLLLELGSDKSLERDGSTAKDLAYDMGHRTIYQLLE